MGKVKKQLMRDQRRRRVRSVVKGTAERPRVSVFRSLRNITVQVIDDAAGRTLLSEQAAKIKKGKAMDKAREVGKLIAEKCNEKKINSLVFDRNGYKYHGKVKAVAEGIREGGITI